MLRRSYAHKSARSKSEMASSVASASEELLDADVASVVSYGARFSGVAYPGETLKVAVWKEDGRLLANVIAPARENAAVLTGVELIPT